MLKVELSRFLQSGANFFIFSILPLKLSLLYVLVLGWLYYSVLNRKARKKIEQNIGKVYREALTPRQIKSLTRKTISNIFAHYAEKLFQACCSYRRWVKYIRTRVEINGLDLLDKALAGGRGVLLVTGHFGAVEFLPSALAFRGYPPVMMAKFKTEKLRSISLERAARAGFSILDCESHLHPFLTAIKYLKEGKALIVECDETDSWHPHPHRQGEFLGHKVVVDKTIDLMVKKTGSPVLTAFVRRRERCRYSLDLREIGPPIDGESVSELSMKKLEEYIRAAPEQWYHWNEFDSMLVDGGTSPRESGKLSATVLESQLAER